MSPEGAARAVFAMIAQRVPEGQVQDMIRMLPDEMRTLFPQE